MPRKSTAVSATPATTPTVEGNEAKVEVVAKPVTETPVTENKGTTARLFPERFEEAPKSEPTPEPVQEKTEEAPATSETVSESSAKDEINLEDFLAKSGIDLSKVRIKTKVDGKEELLPLDDVRNSYQIRKHLEDAAKELGIQRRKLSEDQKNNFEKAKEAVRTPQGTEQAKPNADLNEDEQGLLALAQQVAQLLDPKFKALEEAAAPAIYEQNRNLVDKSLKEIGYDDFMSYIPKIEAHIAKTQDPEMVRFYDTIEGAKSLYFQMKLDEMKEASKKTAETPGLAKPKPPVIRIPIPSGAPASSGADDAKAELRSLLQKAQKTGMLTDSTAVFKKWREMNAQG